MKTELILVAAMDRNRVIGRDGAMPWHLPADLAHFKQITMGHPVLMGRKTFEAIGRALPGRSNIVLTRSDAPFPDGVSRAGSLEEALVAAGASPVMVIGGGEIYRQALPMATGMELTFVDTEVDGDTRFPEWDKDEWDLRATRVLPPDEKNPCRMVFSSLVRKDPQTISDI